MKTILKFIILFYSIFYYADLYGQDNSNYSFLIKKISLKDGYYNIEAARNDSLFLIVSQKRELLRIEKDSLHKIKKGNSYYFDFIIADKSALSDSIIPIKGILNYLDIQYIVIDDRNTQIKLEEKFHNRIYFTSNLIGLYYIPPKK